MQAQKSEILLSFLKEKVDTIRNAIYFNVADHNIELITVEAKYNHQCRLIRLDFDGYFFSVHEQGRITPNTMSVDVFYENENSDRCYIHHFYIAALNCIPNKGYGTKLMKAFLSYIKPFEAKYVSGIISNYDASDPEHKSRLFHFYSKFGFVIGDINNYGDYPIKLNLR